MSSCTVSGYVLNYSRNQKPIEITGLPLPDQVEDKLRIGGVIDGELLEVPLIIFKSPALKNFIILNPS